MIVYVETNFLIVLGLKQQQYEAAARILAMAQTGRIDLAVPALAILESVHTVEGRRKQRSDLGRRIRDEISELQRSAPAPSQTTALENVIGQLTQIGGAQVGDLQESITKVLACGRVLDFGLPVFAEALRYQQTLALSVAGSIIHASIMNDLRPRENPEASCFLSLDRRLVQSSSSNLRGSSCRCIQSFREGLDFIETALG